MANSLSAVESLSVGNVPFKLICQASKLRALNSLKASWACLDSSWHGYSACLINETCSNLAIFQPVLDSLSPFQVVSKLWAALLVRSLCLTNNLRSSTVVCFGSWFGQQLAMLHAIGSYPAKSILVDRDPVACGVARRCLPHTSDFILLEGDALKVDLSIYNNLILVWPGIEHFNPDDVKCVLKTLPQGTRVILQGTDLPDADHINPVHSVEDYDHYFNSDQVLYSGQLLAPFASRFTVVAKL